MGYLHDEDIAAFEPEMAFLVRMGLSSRQASDVWQNLVTAAIRAREHIIVSRCRAQIEIEQAAREKALAEADALAETDDLPDVEIMLREREGVFYIEATIDGDYESSTRVSLEEIVQDFCSCEVYANPDADLGRRGVDAFSAGMEDIEQATLASADKWLEVNKAPQLERLRSAAVRASDFVKKAERAHQLARVALEESRRKLELATKQENDAALSLSGLKGHVVQAESGLRGRVIGWQAGGPVVAVQTLTGRDRKSKGAIVTGEWRMDKITDLGSYDDWVCGQRSAK